MKADSTNGLTSVLAALAVCLRAIASGILTSGASTALGQGWTTMAGPDRPEGDPDPAADTKAAAN